MNIHQHIFDQYIFLKSRECCKVLLPTLQYEISPQSRDDTIFIPCEHKSLGILSQFQKFSFINLQQTVTLQLFISSARAQHCLLTILTTVVKVTSLGFAEFCERVKNSLKVCITKQFTIHNYTFNIRLKVCCKL